MKKCEFKNGSEGCNNNASHSIKIPGTTMMMDVCEKHKSYFKR